MSRSKPMSAKYFLSRDPYEMERLLTFSNQSICICCLQGSLLIRFLTKCKFGPWETILSARRENALQSAKFIVSAAWPIIEVLVPWLIMSAKWESKIDPKEIRYLFNLWKMCDFHLSHPPGLKEDTHNNHYHNNKLHFFTGLPQSIILGILLPPQSWNGNEYEQTHCTRSKNITYRALFATKEN